MRLTSTYFEGGEEEGDYPRESDYVRYRLPCIRLYFATTNFSQQGS